MNCLFTGRWGYNWVVGGGGGVFKEEVYGMRARVKMHTCKEGNMLCEKRKYFLSFLCLRASTCAWQFSLDLTYFALSTIPEETEELFVNLLLPHCTTVILFAL